MDQDLARVTDFDAICSVVQLYIDGCATGNAEKLKQALHDDAWKFGHVGGQRFDMPIAEFIATAWAPPGSTDQTYRGRIVAVAQTGDAAVATVAEDGLMGMSFVDYFLLARIEGNWKIVSEVFAHTGGTMPPREWPALEPTPKSSKAFLSS